jgi:hypothetical protein
MSKYIKLTKPLFPIIVGLIVSMTGLLQAAVIPGSISITNGAPISPQVFGTTNWVLYYAKLGNASENNCEALNPSNTIVAWSATYGLWNSTSNNPAYWTNVFSAAGWYTNVISCTATFQGTDCNGVNYNVSTNASVTNVILVVQITLSLGGGTNLSSGDNLNFPYSVYGFNNVFGTPINQLGKVTPNNPTGCQGYFGKVEIIGQVNPTNVPSSLSFSIGQTRNYYVEITFNDGSSPQINQGTISENPLNYQQDTPNANGQIFAIDAPGEITVPYPNILSIFERQNFTTFVTMNGYTFTNRDL